MKRKMKSGIIPDSTSARLLNSINQFWQIYGYSPSLRELCESTGLKSISTVNWHIMRLAKEGLIKRDSYTTRSIRLTEYGTKWLKRNMGV